MTIAPADPRLAGLVSENTHLIGGEWVPAASGETIAVIDPATGETLMHVPRGAAADVDAAVSAAPRRSRPGATPAPPNGPRCSCGGPS